MDDGDYPYDLMQVVLVTRSGERLEIEARVGALLFVDVERDSCCVSTEAHGWDDMPEVRRRATRRFMEMVQDAVPLLAGR